MQRLDVDRRRRHELLAEQTVDLGVREVIGQPAVEPPLAPVPLRVLLERALGRPQLAVVLVVVGWWSERGRGARERDRVATPRAGTAGSGR